MRSIYASCNYKFMSNFKDEVSVVFNNFEISQIMIKPFQTCLNIAVHHLI